MANMGNIMSTTSTAFNSSMMEELGILKHQISKLKQELSSKEDTIVSLNRENHKLKAVLEKTNLLQVTQQEAIKKIGVSGDSCPKDGSEERCYIPCVEKDFRSKQMIKDALLDNLFLKRFLNSHQLRLIVEAVTAKQFKQGEILCEEGSYGSHLFVISSGICQVSVRNETGVSNKIGPGQAFGELAILYNCTRTATVTALTDVKVWLLDRKVFQAIMLKTGKDKRDEYKLFLKSLPFIQSLEETQLSRIVDSVQMESFPNGQYICNQGARGDSFFIILSGKVRVTQSSEEKNGNEHHEKNIRTLCTGDYFGEQALLVDGLSYRTANVISEGCDCLVLDRENFRSLLADVQEIKDKRYEISQSVKKFSQQDSKQEDIIAEKITLEDLDVIATLGVGGFGRVHLVQWTRKSDCYFALKSCSKAFIKMTQQQQHVQNERIIQKIVSKHDFVTRLYTTLQDSRYIYFVEEACLGGELWTLLRRNGCFSESTARFYVASVILVLEYLHDQNIVYRDLKPENCLLDSQGYLKVTDFGFSKHLEPGEKTWTFCGTPEYVAPEVILNRGHDFAVDFWAVGIFMYELLDGLPPFQSPDPLKTYNIILRGFDAIGFDEQVFSKECVNLIRRLCRERPSERIGIEKNGFMDLKGHKWFSGFNWNQLAKRTMIPPMKPELSGKCDSHYFEVNQDVTNHADFDSGTDDDEDEEDWFKDF